MTEFVADWLLLQVTPERFSVETSQAPYVRVGDLAVRVFAEHLSHTPLRAFGINRNVHFPVQNLTEWDQIGRTLAPVVPWGAWGRKLGLDGKHGGMRSLTMSGFAPEGRPTGGEINVTVAPSYRIGNGRLGVYVGINDHYAINDTEPKTAERLMTLLAENFETSLKRSYGIIDHVMSLAKAKEE